MPENRLLTLLTDFGLSDVYVGVMKGVIAQINPHLKVVDITHAIPPQNIAAARFCLMNAFPYFPEGTVHVAVVDPGVGSRRRAIAVETTAGFLVGPDNGLFSGVLSQYPALAVVELTNPQFWRSPTPSSTFHGRDIFAPVAAHLASGVPLQNLGEALAKDSLVQLPIDPCIQTETGAKGYIQYIDYFGNCVTNIPGAVVLGKVWSAVVAGLTLPSYNTYSDSHPGTALALVGSHGWVEIAVSNGNARSQLGLNLGARVEIKFN